MWPLHHKLPMINTTHRSVSFFFFFSWWCRCCSIQSVNYKQFQHPPKKKTEFTSLFYDRKKSEEFCFDGGESQTIGTLFTCARRNDQFRTGLADADGGSGGGGRGGIDDVYFSLLMLQALLLPGLARMCSQHGALHSIHHQAATEEEE